MSEGTWHSPCVRPRPPDAGLFYSHLSLQLTHRGLVLVEHLVIAAECDTEDDGRDILEAVDPLFAFRSLAPHIEQPARSQGRL